jgi:hypothetical protein
MPLYVTATQSPVLPLRTVAPTPSPMTPSTVPEYPAVERSRSPPPPVFVTVT